jgi:hypothetical protein
MNDSDDMHCYLDRWLHDYGENTRPLPFHPFSASTLALNAGLEWPSPSLAWSEPPMRFPDPSAQY